MRTRRRVQRQPYNLSAAIGTREGCGWIHECDASEAAVRRKQTKKATSHGPRGDQSGDEEPRSQAIE